MKRTQSVPAALRNPNRLLALRQTQLIGSPPEKEFDRLTHLGVEALHAPIAAITLIDEERQFLKSAVGFPGPYQSRREIPLSHSICKHMIRSGEQLIVQDARKHPSLRRSPALEELGVVAYAGAPIRLSDGHIIGSFFVADTAVRKWSPEEQRVLADLTAVAEEEILLHTLRRQKSAQGSPATPTARETVEELLSSTARFHALVEQSIVGIGIIQHSRVRYANPRFAEMFGYTEQEILELSSVLDLVAEEDRARVEDNLRRRIEGETDSLRYKFLGRHKDGRVLHVEVHGSRTEIDGTPAVVGVLLDITERELAEQALRGSEERMRYILDAAHDAFVATDHNGLITDWNTQAEHTFGWSRAEAVGQPMAEMIIPPSQREMHRRGVEHFLSTGEGPILGQRIEVPALHRDGHEFPVELAVTALQVDGSFMFASFLHDITRRKRAEEELRRSEEQFRSLVENAWDIIHILDAQGVIRYISPAVEEVLGYTPEEITGRPGAELVHPEDREAAEKAFEEDIQQTGMVRVLEIRLRHKDGSWRTVLSRGQVISDDGVAPIVIVNTRDVTLRKEAEEALRRSEERYRLVARATNDVLWEWDTFTGQLRWSEPTAKVLRYSKEEVGTSIEWWYERLHPEDRERVLSGLHSLISGADETWSVEYRFLRGDGSYAVFLDRGYVVRDDRGTPVRMLGTMLDVTERRRSEEAQRFLARASSLLEGSLDPTTTLIGLARFMVPTLADYCLIDLVSDGVLSRVAAAHVEGAKERLLHEEEARTLTDVEEDPTLKAVRRREPVLIVDCTDSFLQAIARDAADRKRLRRLRPRSLLAVPLAVHQEVLGVITLATTQPGRRYGPMDLLLLEDLGRRIALALENARLYRQAQDAAAAREHILGVVSHDLRNPVNTIQIATSLLRDANQERRSENLKWLDIVHRSTEQMTRMIEDLLDLSSIDSGRFSIAVSELSLSSVLDEAWAMMEPIAQQKKIHLRCEREESSAAIWADSHRILRVFSNLAGNALKFTPEGGTVTLRARSRGEDVLFGVSDTGPGISPEQLPYVFDRYWQARNGDRRGAGLGLSIAKGIVEAHGGRIWVESTPGKGTTFFFTLPSRREGPPS